MVVVVVVLVSFYYWGVYFRGWVLVRDVVS